MIVTTMIVPVVMPVVMPVIMVVIMVVMMLMSMIVSCRGFLVGQGFLVESAGCGSVVVCESFTTSNCTISHVSADTKNYGVAC